MYGLAFTSVKEDNENQAGQAHSSCRRGSLASGCLQEAAMGAGKHCYLSHRPCSWRGISKAFGVVR